MFEFVENQCDTKSMFRKLTLLIYSFVPVNWKDEFVGVRQSQLPIS